MDRQRRLQKVRRERTLSLKQVEKSRKTAATVRESLARRGLRSESGEAEMGKEVLTGDNLGEESTDVDVSSGVKHEYAHATSHGTTVQMEEEKCERLSQDVDAMEDEAADGGEHEGEGARQRDRVNNEVDMGVAYERNEEVAVEERVSEVVISVGNEDLPREHATSGDLPRERATSGEATVPMEVDDDDEATDAVDEHRQIPPLETYVYAVHRRAVSEICIRCHSWWSGAMR